MSKTTRHVLKAAEVTLDDPFQLGIDPASTACRSGSRSAAAASSVRISENHPEYVVLEVTCPCGRTTYVRCDYPAAALSPA